jgi:TM2 domain-containing membrane protein YozV
MAVSEKPKMNVILLCCLGFAGVAGIHRFYCGKVLTGLLWLFTGGLCGVGTVIDLISIGTDKFRDSAGDTVQAR